MSAAVPASCPASPSLVRVALASPVDRDGFRAAVRRLVAAGVAPESVLWRVEGSEDEGAGTPGELFAASAVQEPATGTPPDADTGARCAAGGAAPAVPVAPALRVADAAPRATPSDAAPPPAMPAADASTAPPLRVPRALAGLVDDALLHSDPERFVRVHRLVARLQREPHLRDDPLDPDVLAVRRLAREVARERHRMHALVRLRPVERGDGQPTLHVGWYVPAHHVVESAAPHFVARFANLHWALLTPRRSVRWDGHALVFGPGAGRAEAPPADAGEALWLTYYAHVFNPARVNLPALRRQLPARHWRDLPEGALIEVLAAEAPRRERTMIDQPPTAARARARARSDPPGLPSGVPVRWHVDASLPAAARADAWRATADAAARCTDCPLHEAATQTVFGEGPVDAPLMFVGEQPGDREDVRGRPFVGPAGALFALALDELGVARERVYVTNAVKHFKHELRGTRRIHKTASQQEAAACLHWLERELGLVRPAVIVALGATAAGSLLGRAVAVMRERGRWAARDDGRRVLVTLHPSALLRLPEAEREAAYARWLDDLAVAVRAAGSPGVPPAPSTDPGAVR